MGIGSQLLGPALRAAFRSSERSARPLLPHPDDDGTISVEGPAALRVLLTGGGVAEGYGVRSHELAATGQLARALHATTGRGTEVDVLLMPSEPIARVLQGLGTRRGGAYDAAVLFMTFADASSGVAPARWRHEVRGSIATLRDGNDDLALVVVGTPPVSVAATIGPTMARLVGPHATELNRVTRQVTAEFPNSEYVDLPIHPNAPRLLGAEDYRRIAVALAASIAPRLPPR